ncbi:hypothetical protein [Kocuria sp. NPDC057446]|uniref:hypothetical protein n=1 Tax=Kocuria sp. NPDC057446 TaxID=3346137 RepID=UPI0036A0816B
MTAPSVLAAAETKLLKAKRAYARKLIGLLADHLHHHHPQAVRLSVYAERRAGDYFVGELLDADDEAIAFDPAGVVVPLTQTDGPFGEPITIGFHHVEELLRRALSTHDGPLTKLLRAEAHTGEHYLDLPRGRQPSGSATDHHGVHNDSKGPAHVLHSAEPV